MKIKYVSLKGNGNKVPTLNKAKKCKVQLACLFLNLNNGANPLSAQAFFKNSCYKNSVVAS